MGDVPSLKFVGDVDPSDISQGGVGDCWLLSGISSLAEFDGAIARLFRKTEGLERMPQDPSPHPNHHPDPNPNPNPNPNPKPNPNPNLTLSLTLAAGHAQLVHGLALRPHHVAGGEF